MRSLDTILMNQHNSQLSINQPEIASRTDAIVGVALMKEFGFSGTECVF